MKHLHIIFIAFLTICISSCHQRTARGRIRTDTTLDSKGYSYTTDYTYDALGRLLTSCDTLNQDTTWYNYDHRDSILSHHRLRSQEDTVVWLLNSQGYVIFSGDTAHYFHCLYDSLGFLISEGFGKTMTVLRTISGHDIASKTLVTINGDTSVETYIYCPERDYRDYGQPYLGRSSEHLVRTDTYRSAQGATSIRRHTYTFDAEGRVHTETITKSGTTGSLMYTYTYFD